MHAHRFWKIAIPVMAFVIPLFMWSDLGRAAHYAEKRWTARRSMMVRGCFVCRVLWYVNNCLIGCQW